MAAPTVSPPPQLTLEQAKEALDKAITVFETNMPELKGIIEECNKEEDPMKRQMQLMSKMLPAVQKLLKSEMEKFGFDESNMMMGMMQIQMHSAQDKEMQPKVMRIMNALQGKFDA
eukprot:TRINITY_DN80540_c0_g1_i1.p2 TRINITY_DN80540_c0_g1~~TRINITY_DN80540_c0_g1_i1.p2  ORF type:complete len:116 (+),score=57.49 TRINITY_DN80540_c0_g1_i1:101-448(+)